MLQTFLTQGEVCSLFRKEHALCIVRMSWYNEPQHRCEELDSLTEKIKQQKSKHYTVRLMHDKVRPHLRRLTHKKLMQLV